jgi:hypothetical protein
MKRLLPAYSRLAELRDQGLTHQEIADKLSEETGERIARSTVSVALKRSGESKSHRPRFKETIPWTVPVRFGAEYPVRMLRLLGRKIQDLPMSEAESARLESWMLDLETRNLIVGFCPQAPDDAPGFYYIPASARDHNDLAVPIRREPVTPRQIGL